MHDFLLRATNATKFRLPILSLTATVSLFMAPPASAQTPPAAGAVDGSVQKPIAGAGHDYIHMLSETVNPATGQLSLRIEFPVPKGRGITPPAIVAYNSAETESLIEPEGSALWATSNQNRAGAANGWGNSSDYLLSQNSSVWNFTSPEPPQGYSEIQNCNYATGYSFTDLNGVSHTLGVGAMTLAMNNSSGGQCGTATPTTGSDGQVTAVMASNAVQQLANGIAPSVSIIDIYGNTYGSGAAVEDRNGNQITTSDTAGRTPVFQLSALAGTYNVYGLSYTIATENITVAYTPKYVLTWADGAGNCNVTAEPPENSATITVIKSITLPNGQEYQFTYDPTFGVIDQIQFPDGGTVSYNWALSTYSNGAVLYPNVAAFPALQTGTGQVMDNACTVQYQVPVVTGRTVDFDGSSAAQYQTFTYSTTWNQTVWTAKSTSVETTDEITGKSFLTSYSYAPTGNDIGVPFSTAYFPTVPMEATVKHYDWGNTSTPLDTVTEAWYNQFQKACEVHTLNNSQSYGHFYTWSYGFISDDKSYDMGQVSNLASYCTPTGAAPPSTTAARETVTTFQQFTSPTVPSLTFAKPATVTSYGSGTELAETTYAYDQFSLQAVASLTGHDETYFPAAVTAGRGNVTTVTHKCLNNGCSGDSVTTYHYDETGQVLSMTDACGNGTCADMPSGSSHTTTYSWADNYSSGAPPSGKVTNTYLTKITYPSTKATHTESFSYSYELGQLTSSIDENNLTTNYQYDDFDRLTETQGPPDPNNGNQQTTTTVSYDDAAPNPSVTTSELLNTSAVWKTSTAVRDGMGHTVQTQVSDPSGNDYVDSLYDGEGRVYEQSNPTRCSATPGQMPSSCSESSWGITKSYYDALGRSTLVVHPDATYATNCYNNVASTVPSGYSVKCNGQIGASTGSWVDSVDENGNTWQRSSDAFGDLLEAIEPNGSSKTPSMQTSYAYDGLSHLLKVIQQGDGSGNRNRYFAYDSQGHLVATMNPENFGSINSPTSGGTSPAGLTCTGASSPLYSGSWTTCYTFDLNGNLVTKEDNRKVTTTVSYDNLNRVIQDSYNDGVTPASGFGYDGYDQAGNAISGLKYPIGRLSKSTNESVNAASEYSYDVMGRLQNRYNCIPGDCSYDINVHAQYDLGGDLTTLTNGSIQQPVQFAYAYDSVARLVSLTSNWAPDCNHPATLFSAPAYGPVGLTSATLSAINSGCPSASTNLISETRGYDNRARISTEGYGASAIEVNAPTGTISLTGSEQSQLTGVAAGTGWISISGTEQSTTIQVSCGPSGQTCPQTVYDDGTVTATINGTQYTTGYGQGMTSSALATNLAAAINGGTLVTASVNGTQITLTAKTTGWSTNYSLSVKSATNLSQYFSSPSFSAGDSGSTLTGGSNGTYIYDTGTITATVNGKQATANWGQSSTAGSVATALASALNSAAGSYINASANGGVVTVKSNGTQYWPLSVSATNTNSNFASSSFSGTAGGMNASDTSGTVYSYSVGYDGVGNTTALTDSVMGTWSYQYDTLNRLATTGQASGGPYNGQYGCWTYDGFGNRTMEAISPTACNSSPTPTFQAQYNASNQVKETGLMPAGYDYDAAGDVTADGANSYLYDGAGRICAAKSAAGVLTGYIYDGEGNRVAKGSLSSWPSNNVCPAVSQISVNTQYVLGLGGEQLTEIYQSQWNHTNVFAGGALLATYSGVDTYFDLTDWQGTKRAEDSAGGCVTGWISLPYGNYGTNPGSTPTSIDSAVQCTVDATEHHYTSKLHDSETGNDDFGARYYASTEARWLSPDWAAGAEAVPYASYGSPQTLNLYAFVGNNPLSKVDPDGHNFYRAGNLAGDPGATDLFGEDGSMGVGGAVGADFASPDDGDWNPYQAPPPPPPQSNQPPQQSQTDQQSSTKNNSPTSGVCSEDGPHIVRDAAVKALSNLNPGQDETQNITPSDGNFAKVEDPSKINTKTWTDAESAHGTSKQSPTIPGQSTFVVKLYNDPKRGNIIAVVFPNGTVSHMMGLIPFLAGSTSVNVPAARAYMGCQ